MISDIYVPYVNNPAIKKKRSARMILRPLLGNATWENKPWRSLDKLMMKKTTEIRSPKGRTLESHANRYTR